MFSGDSVTLSCLFRYNVLSFVYLIYLLLIPLFAEPTKTTMQVLSMTRWEKTAAQGHKAILRICLKTDAICPLEGMQETRWLPEEIKQNGEVVGKGP
ncbi:piezo-type mechanosensitive ion channel component 2 isoform X1 [Tachysurus ichikawai]